MPLWRIYYGNGETFDGDMGTPSAAPGRDVCVIVQPDETVGRSLLHRWDWYYWNGLTNRWWGGDVHGVLDQFTHDRNNQFRALKQGGMVESDTFDTILKRAMADPDFTPKSAKLPLERREGIR